MKKLIFLTLLIALGAAASVRVFSGQPSGQPGPLPLQQPQINAGTSTGALAVRIAVPEFPATSSDEKTTRLAALFNQVLWDDLDYSGVVTLVSRSFYPLGKFAQPADIKVEEWTNPTVDVQFVAFGNVSISGSRLRIETRLWDMKNAQNREVFPGEGKGGEDTEDTARLIAHRFADQIISFLGGGIRGISETKIAYVSERGAGVKEIYVMDYDGNNAFALTSYKNTSMMPSWAPDGEKVAYVTLRRGTSDIEIMSRIDRRVHPFEKFRGTNLTPVWSPDGSRIAFTSSKDGTDTEIYVADWNGRNSKRLTLARSIEVSPSWNPKTGQQIAFVSNRSGTPQIFMMDVEGTNVTRVITEGSEAQNPAWSPDGQRIAFAWQKSGSYFDIWIHELATGQNHQLTRNQGSNERPTWAPDGRHIAFASTRNGTSQIYSMLADGTKVRQLTRNGKNEGPAWSGYIGQ